MVLILLFVRILGALAVCPLFSASYLSTFLRASLALTLALTLYPLYAHIILAEDIFSRLTLILSNLAYGGLLGYLISLPMWLVESCGNIIDTQRGEQMGSLLNLSSGNRSSSMGGLMLKAFIAYWVINNGLLFFIDFLFSSFSVIPVNHLLPVLDVQHINRYIWIISNYFYWVVVLALPLIIIMLLIDLSLGLMSSFIPQLNVTIMAMPIKSTLALMGLAIYLGQLFHNVFSQFLMQLRHAL